MTPIDLEKQFGRSYRIEMEESWAAGKGAWHNGDALWLKIIPCRCGHIYVHSDTHLGWASDGRGSIAKQMASFCQVIQDGEDGINVIFPLGAFPGVAALVKPRRRRRLTDEAKAKLLAASEPYRFLPSKHGAGAQNNGQGRAQGGK